jgi:hypothetical protein
MENFTGRWCQFFLDRLQAATLFDFCVAVLLIAVCGWLLSRADSR